MADYIMKTMKRHNNCIHVTVGLNVKTVTMKILLQAHINFVTLTFVLPIRNTSIKSFYIFLKCNVIVYVLC
jgi:hypothetical protein